VDSVKRYRRRPLDLFDFADCPVFVIRSLMDLYLGYDYALIRNLRLAKKHVFGGDGTVAGFDCQTLA